MKGLQLCCQLSKLSPHAVTPRIGTGSLWGETRCEQAAGRPAPGKGPLVLPICRAPVTRASAAPAHGRDVPWPTLVETVSPTAEKAHRRLVGENIAHARMPPMVLRRWACHCFGRRNNRCPRSSALGKQGTGGRRRLDSTQQFLHLFASAHGPADGRQEIGLSEQVAAVHLIAEFGGSHPWPAGPAREGLRSMVKWTGALPGQQEDVLGDAVRAAGLRLGDGGLAAGDG